MQCCAVRHANYLKDDGRHQVCGVLAGGAVKEDGLLPPVCTERGARQQLEHLRELVALVVHMVAVRGVDEIAHALGRGLRFGPPQVHAHRPLPQSARARAQYSEVSTTCEKPRLKCGNQRRE
ncbi:hypothetical protein LDHU3_35.3395:CDS1 [Leishmania donovani]|uniref:Hypothetical_protein_conserved n=1 Tax=Leishmania donovani TaxID=5661 RepID=A0A6J8FME9_LEIDO|nr:hypothetical protein LDHU3_35.3395:CDS1 [Leishmania donovani]VDZ48900.1 hypothetical_protein_conserved [Leishmania donovani]